MRREYNVESYPWLRRALLLGAAAGAALAVGCGHFGAVASAPNADRALLAGTHAHGFDTIPSHVHTWVYADHVQPAPVWSTVQPFLDYALVGQSIPDFQLASAIGAAGIGVVEYTNPNRQSQIGPPPHFPNNLPADYAHDCKGDRIYKIGYGSSPPPPGPEPTPTDHAMYLMDPHSANLAVSWTGEVTNFAAQSGTVPVYVFEDSADSIDSTAPHAPCHYGQPDWTTATNSLGSSMLAGAAAVGVTTSIVYNGLGSPLHPSPTHTPDAIGMNAVSAGGMAENCYSRQPASTNEDPDPEPWPEKDSQWLDTENVEIAMAAAQKMFVCNANSDQAVDAPQQAGLRLYVIASFLLTYDPNTSVLDELFRPASGFSVFPESEIVALDPLATPPSQITDLNVGGVYARQYGTCYLNGVLFGSCATVVNPSSTATNPFPYPGAYAGSLKLVGGGVLDAGARVKFLTSVPSVLGPRSAVIAFATPAPSPTP
jgi:hypothetical protein